MKADVEIYKGIEYVRLSSLPREQARSIQSSVFFNRVIKILYHNEILHDCLPYAAYLEWYHETLPAGVEAEAEYAGGVKRYKFA